MFAFRRIRVSGLALALACALLPTVGGAEPAVNARGKPRVAVFDFTFSRQVREKLRVRRSNASAIVSLDQRLETATLTDKFIVRLTRSQKLEVVERNEIAGIIQELELGASALADPANSARVGKLLGADYLLHGSIFMLNESVNDTQLPYGAGVQRVYECGIGASIRLIATETGAIVAADEDRVVRTAQALGAEGPRRIPDDYRDETYNALVDNLVAKVIDALFPIKIAAFQNEVAYLSRGNLLVGQRYTVLTPGEEVLDPDTGESLGATETRFALIEIFETTDKLSKARIVEWATSNHDLPRGSICRSVSPPKTPDVPTLPTQGG